MFWVRVTSFSIKNSSEIKFFYSEFIYQLRSAAVSAVFQPGRIEGTKIIRRLLQHPEWQGQVD